MAKVKFIVRAKKRETAPIYVRFSAGRKADLLVNSHILIDTDRWSNKTETIKQRITTEEDKKIIEKLKNLRDHIESARSDFYGIPDRKWLEAVIEKFHTKKNKDSKTLNDFITTYIQEAKAGEKKNKSGEDLSEGTIRTWEGFKRIFDEYQGIYTEKRKEEIVKEELRDKKKYLRPLMTLDYDDITLSFYESFKAFLSNHRAEYKTNTIGRFIKALKFFMQRSMNEKKHTSIDFKNTDYFKVLSEETFAISLSEEELVKIFNKDLRGFNERVDRARDAFIVLCETALRISDYKKIDTSICTIENRRFIDIRQTKTSDRVLIPLTTRFEAIWKKHGEHLPVIPEQYVNKYIKTVAALCNIDEVVTWEVVKNGKRFSKSAKKYELLGCHSGRRTACTKMYKAGIPLKDIRTISGHSSDKQLENYIRIGKEENAVRIAAHPYFKNNLKAV